MNARTKPAGESRRKTGIIPLVVTMIVVALVVDWVATFSLYSIAVRERADRLTELADSQAELIGTIAKFNRFRFIEALKQSPESARASTVEQIELEHKICPVFGRFGEITLTRREAAKSISFFPTNSTIPAERGHLPTPR